MEHPPHEPHDLAENLAKSAEKAIEKALTHETEELRKIEKEEEQNLKKGKENLKQSEKSLNQINQILNRIRHWLSTIILIAISLLSVSITSLVYLHIHNHAIKVEEHRDDIQTLSEEIKTLSKHKSELNAAMINLRTNTLIWQTFCEGAKFKGSFNDLREFTKERITIVGQLAALNYHTRRLFNKKIFEEIVEFNKIEKKRNICGKESTEEAAILEQRKIDEDLEKFIKEKERILRKMRVTRI